MDIATLLSPDRVVLGLRVAGKAALLAELARRIAPAAGLEPAEIATALAAREQLGSTGLGRGFALPHARLAGLSGFVGLFARLAAPVAFEAVDGAPVDLVFLLLTPADAGGGHLAALAAISRRLREEPVAAGLRAASSPQDAYRLLAQPGPAQ